MGDRVAPDRDKKFCPRRRSYKARSPALLAASRKAAPAPGGARWVLHWPYRTAFSPLATANLDERRTGAASAVPSPPLPTRPRLDGRASAALASPAWPSPAAGLHRSHVALGERIPERSQERGGGVPERVGVGAAPSVVVPEQLPAVGEVEHLQQDRTAHPACAHQPYTGQRPAWSSLNRSLDASAGSALRKSARRPPPARGAAPKTKGDTSHPTHSA